MNRKVKSIKIIMRLGKRMDEGKLVSHMRN